MALPRRSSPVLAHLTPGVLWIIVVTVAAFVGHAAIGWYDRLPAIGVTETLELRPSGLFEVGPQGLLTIVLLHDGLLHLFFNMLVLFSLGPVVERGLGTKRFLLLYMVATLAGSLLFVAVGYATGRPDVPAVGASGAVFGVIAAFSILYPDAQVRIWFTAPMRAGYVIWVALAADLIFALAGTPVAVPVHVGGAILARS
ncbi:MAG: rhomboid family intramembrane serine protease [Deltaproteobacteria bacterium]|nr:rhomboid family intramembrane serine protease [Deltaproteobacteria bacterium]